MIQALLLATVVSYQTDLNEKLFDAVNDRNLILCEKLVKQGADPTVLLPDHSSNAIERLEVNRATVEKEREFVHQCLEMFFENGIEPISKRAYKSVIYTGPMTNAFAARCLYQSLQVLLDHGADPNGTVVNGYTPLYAVLNKQLHHVEISTSTPEYYEGMWPHAVKTVEVLLTGGADPSIPSPEGVSLISIPVYHGKIELVRMFLEHGADVNARRAIPDPQWYAKLYDYTPLHTAALEPGPNKAEIAKLLLKHGADRTLKDALGRTALDIALQRKNTAVAKVLERN